MPANYCSHTNIYKIREGSRGRDNVSLSRRHRQQPEKVVACPLDKITVPLWRILSTTVDGKKKLIILEHFQGSQVLFTVGKSGVTDSRDKEVMSYAKFVKFVLDRTGTEITL